MAGGGVGEAMLIGAAVGAASGGGMAALKDEDPLQGALMGAALGAAGGGIGSAVGGAASGAATGATSGVTTGATTGAATGATTGAVTGTTAGTGATSGLAGAGGYTIPGVGMSAATPIAGTTTTAIPGTTLAGAGGAGGSGAGWGAQGVGQGMFPRMTNAQAYGAGVGGGIAGLVGGSINQNNMAYEPEPYSGALSQFSYNPSTYRPTTYSPTRGYADGGVTTIAQPRMYPQGGIETLQFSQPTQMPASREVIGSDYDSRINPYTGDMMMAEGGISHLGGYSDGGRLLRGPGDGMSDHIPASIAGKQPARLADGEFVVPADVVSHLGNGSTDAGAKQLYAMMDKVRKDRTGNKKQGKQIKAEKYMPGMAAGGAVKRYADGGLFSSGYQTPVISGGKLGYVDEDGNFVALDGASSAPQVPGTSGFKASTYDPNYYNPQYYQSQLDAANTAIQQAQATLSRPTSYGNAIGMEGQTVNLQPGTQVVYGADGRYSAPVTVGQSGQIDLSNAVFGDPIVGTKKQAYLYDPSIASAADIDAANKAMAEQQAAAAAAQQNVSRLQDSSVAYSPYTLANRPSQDEPQFYGNIYRPANFGEYARPGYDMNAQLGVWNNEYGAANAPTARQEKIAGIAAAQAAASDVAFQQAQQAAQQAMKQPEKEEKKRRGGIASLV